VSKLVEGEIMEKLRMKVLFSREEIDRVVRGLGEQISRDYQGKDLVVVCVLKGAFMFMADLVRYLKGPCVIDFIRLASYGSGTSTSGTVTVTKDLETAITGKDVLIVEDIIDTGITLDFLVKKLKEQKPASLRVCTLVDKKHRRKIEFKADYVGFDLDKGFILGYGIDFDERARYLPDIYVMEE
jgi:hypoxanthine phosphoribosyltransferase